MNCQHGNTKQYCTTCLQSEVAELRENNAGLEDEILHQTMRATDAEAALTAERAKCEALSKDAWRYRWLVNHLPSTEHVKSWPSCYETVGTRRRLKRGATLTDAIDGFINRAAIAASSPEHASEKGEK